MNRIKVLFFATLRDRAGIRAAELDVPTGMTIVALKDRLSQDYPNLGPSLNTALVAVNREFAPEDAVLSEGAEVAFFPPVSGG